MKNIILLLLVSAPLTLLSAGLNIGFPLPSLPSLPGLPGIPSVPGVPSIPGLPKVPNVTDLVGAGFPTFDIAANSKLAEIRDQLSQIAKQVGSYETAISSLGNGLVASATPDAAPSRPTATGSDDLLSITLGVSLDGVRLPIGATFKFGSTGEARPRDKATYAPYALVTEAQGSYQKAADNSAAEATRLQQEEAQLEQALKDAKSQAETDKINGLLVATASKITRLKLDALLAYQKFQLASYKSAAGDHLSGIAQNEELSAQHQALWEALSAPKPVAPKVP